MKRCPKTDTRPDLLFQLIQAVRKYQETWDAYAFRQFEELERRVDALERSDRPRKKGK